MKTNKESVKSQNYFSTKSSYGWQSFYYIYIKGIFMLWVGTSAIGWMAGASCTKSSLWEQEQQSEHHLQYQNVLGVSPCLEPRICKPFKEPRNWLLAWRVYNPIWRTGPPWLDRMAESISWWGVRCSIKELANRFRLVGTRQASL
jgi:hypothetical protein